MSDTGSSSKNRATRVRPVERFLGAPEAAGGPFALLGLIPAEINDEAVLVSLEHQLERINTHAHCDTPEADEVRLALHAAAAQLLDPVVRRHLVARWTGAAAPRTAAPASRPSLVFPSPSVDAMRMLEHDAILTLGVLGWNQRSLRRLASLAHKRGLSNQQVATALRGLSRMRRRRTGAHAEPASNGAPALPTRPPESGFNPPAHAAAPPPRPAPPPPRFEPEVIDAAPDPGQEILKKAVMLGALGFALLIGAALLIVVLTAGPRTKTPVPPPPGGTPAASGVTGASGTAPEEPVQIPTNTPPIKARAPAPPPDPADAAGIGRALASAADGVSVDPQAALTRFSDAVARLAAGWPTLPRDRLVSAHDSVLEFIYRSANSPEVTASAVEAIARGARAAASPPVPAGQVVPAVWSTGMLVRLSRERDIPASARAVVESAIAAALGPARPTMDQSFEAGAAAMLFAFPSLLIPAQATPGTEIDADAWQRWAESAVALAGADAGLNARLLLAGLETLLVAGPEANQSKSTGVVVTDLVGRISWRKGDESRRWLLRWFGDRRITVADLHGVTSALATRSSAEGVDLTMVLSTSASERVRADLHDRYATVWDVAGGAAGDELASAWVKAAKEVVEQSASVGVDLDQLEFAVVMARLNEAAWWQWRGDGGEAATILGDLRGPVDQAKSSSAAAGNAGLAPPTDGGWAEKYLATAAGGKAKKELLDQLKAPLTQLGPVEAEVIAGEALGSGPSDLRAAASELVKLFADTPPMVNALLERLPKMPRTQANSMLIEAVCQRQLPSVREPSWQRVARRALIEKLLEVKAAEGPMARADRLAALLALSYRDMASPAPLTTDQRRERPQPAAHLSAGQVWSMWRDAADRLVPLGAAPVRLDEVERRRAGRQSLARGLVQQFAAEQASLCELMGYVIGAEKPGRADDARAILAGAAEERRRSENILEQLMATERAMTRLWLMRLEPPPPPPEPPA